MKIVLLYNPKSGGALSLRELQKKCDVNGIVIDKSVPLIEGFEKKLKPFVDRGATIAVVGGDGTISAAARCIAGSKALLAPLPGGTLNHFTKDLGIPQDIDEAFAALKTAKSHSVDVAAVNGTIFINNSSIGLYPLSLRERDRQEDKLGKWPAAVIASVRTLVRLPGYTVTIDGDTFRTPFIFVGNNTYKMETIGAPVRSKLSDGVLSVFIAKKMSRLGLMRIGLLSLIGKAHLVNDFEIRTTKLVTIKTLRRHPNVSRDGEVSRMTSPLRYEVRPGLLRVLR